MAQYVNQYVAELLQREHDLAQAQPDVIGTDPMYSSKSVYNLNLMTLILIGVVMKRISTIAPQVTDQVWIDDLSHALDGPWPAWILNQDPSVGR